MKIRRIIEALVVLIIIMLGVWSWHQYRPVPEAPKPPQPSTPIKTGIPVETMRTPNAEPETTAEAALQPSPEPPEKDNKVQPDTNRFDWTDEFEISNASGIEMTGMDADEPSGRLKIKLIDEAGRPYLAGCKMSASASISKNSIRSLTEDIPAGQSDYSGLIPAGLCHLLFIGRDGHTGELRVDITTNVQMQADVVMEEQAGKVITGTVIRRYDLLAISNAKISVSLNKELIGAQLPSVETDISGRFSCVIPDAAGAHNISIMVEHPNYCTYSEAVDPATSPLCIYLVNGATLQVCVTDINGQPWSNADIDFSVNRETTTDRNGRKSYKGILSSYISHDALVESRGIITFTHLKPGKAVVAIKIHGDSANRENQVPTELKDNSVARVTVHMPE